MNNVNTQEPGLKVVVDGKAAQRGGGQAAKTDEASGKNVPSAEPVRQPERKAEPQASRVAPEPRVEQAVAKLNDYVQSLQRDLRFSIDKDLGRAVVNVIDRDSQEVIRQIPNETALRLARNLKEKAEQTELVNIAGDTASSAAQASLGLINTRI